jgi:hypothetical protein
MCEKITGTLTPGATKIFVIGRTRRWQIVHCNALPWLGSASVNLGHRRIRRPFERGQLTSRIPDTATAVATEGRSVRFRICGRRPADIA